MRQSYDVINIMHNYEFIFRCDCVFFVVVGMITEQKYLNEKYKWIFFHVIFDTLKHYLQWCAAYSDGLSRMK